jgi:hypothetical protein
MKVGQMRKFGAALAISVLFTTAACGGGGGDRPSSGDISKALKGKSGSIIGLPSSVNDKAIDCIADAIESSKLSDKTVRALVKGDKNYKGSSSDEKALSGLTSKIGSCVTK